MKSLLKIPKFIVCLREESYVFIVVKWSKIIKIIINYIKIGLWCICRYIILSVCYEFRTQTLIVLGCSGIYWQNNTGCREIVRQQVIKRSVLAEASAGQVFATCRRGDEFLPGQDGHAVSHQGSEIVPTYRATRPVDQNHKILPFVLLFPFFHYFRSLSSLAIPKSPLEKKYVTCDVIISQAYIDNHFDSLLKIRSW